LVALFRNAAGALGHVEWDQGAALGCSGGGGGVGLKYPEATEIAKRVLAIREKALGPEHPAVGTALNDLAWLALAQGDWAQAADYWRCSDLAGNLPALSR
jgi:hypothetical protein